MRVVSDHKKDKQLPGPDGNRTLVELGMASEVADANGNG